MPVPMDSVLLTLAALVRNVLACCTACKVGQGLFSGGRPDCVQFSF